MARLAGDAEEAGSPLDFAERGPHAVGVRTFELPDPDSPDRVLTTDLWYPADPTACLAAPMANHPFQRPHLAHQAPSPTPGVFPLIAFSHGNSGLRRQSTFLTTHLASWGMRVVAPDHRGNTFSEMATLRGEDQRRRAHFEARGRRPGDLALAIEAALHEDTGVSRADPERVAVLGHSFGGWTGLKMPARDRRIRAVCGLAPASEPFVGRKAFEPGELPFATEIPVLIAAGSDDVLVDLETSVRPLFERLSAPRVLVAIDGADHFHFCDGVQLLHGLHVGNPRANQPRPTRPWGAVLPEDRMHRLLRGLVTHFFACVFASRTDSWAQIESGALTALDPALRRLE